MLLHGRVEKDIDIRKVRKERPGLGFFSSYIPSCKGVSMEENATNSAMAASPGFNMGTLNPRMLTAIPERYLRELEGRKAQEDRMLDPIAAPRRLDVDALLTQPSPSTPSSRRAFGLHPRDVAQQQNDHHQGHESNGWSSRVLNPFIFVSRRSTKRCTQCQGQHRHSPQTRRACHITVATVAVVWMTILASSLRFFKIPLQTTTIPLPK